MTGCKPAMQGAKHKCETLMICVAVKSAYVKLWAECLRVVRVQMSDVHSWQYRCETAVCATRNVEPMYGPKYVCGLFINADTEL